MNRTKRIVYSVIALTLTLGLIYGSSSVSAHSLTDHNKLAEKLAKRFHLNQDEVRRFLYEYENEVDYVESNAHVDYSNDHLNFIDRKMSEGVSDGWFTAAQKKLIMAKLKEKMDQGPRSSAYRAMSESERQEKINVWRKEMSQWAVKNGFTLDRIRNVTGKGNKYLMGMEF